MSEQIRLWKYFHPGRSQASDRAPLSLSDNLLTWFEHGGGREGNPWRLWTLAEWGGWRGKQPGGSVWWVHGREICNNSRKHPGENQGNEFTTSVKWEGEQEQGKSKCSPSRLGWLWDARPSRWREHSNEEVNWNRWNSAPESHVIDTNLTPVTQLVTQL